MNRKQIIIVALFCIGWGVATIVLNSDRITGGEARHIFPRQAQVQPSASITDPIPEYIDRRVEFGAAVATAGLVRPVDSGTRSGRRALVKGEQLCRSVTGIVCDPGYAIPIEDAVVEFVTVGQMYYGNVAELVQSGAAVSRPERIVTGKDGTFEILNGTEPALHGTEPALHGTEPARYAQTTRTRHR